MQNSSCLEVIKIDSDKERKKFFNSSLSLWLAIVSLSWNTFNKAEFNPDKKKTPKVISYKGAKV